LAQCICRWYSLRAKPSSTKFLLFSFAQGWNLNLSGSFSDLYWICLN
jgi:hypothetical protein